VEAATGADAGAVDRTRHPELLETWTARHYEVVPGVAVQMVGEPKADTADRA
jgi:hypothetical protein